MIRRISDKDRSFIDRSAQQTTELIDLPMMQQMSSSSSRTITRKDLMVSLSSLWITRARTYTIHSPTTLCALSPRHVITGVPARCTLYDSPALSLFLSCTSLNKAPFIRLSIDAFAILYAHKDKCRMESFLSQFLFPFSLSLKHLENVTKQKGYTAKDYFLRWRIVVQDGDHKNSLSNISWRYYFFDE